MRGPLKRRARAAVTLAWLATIMLTLSHVPTLEAAPVKVADGSGSVSNWAKIDGQQGGTLKAGRWTVTVPPGAYTGNATIFITVPDKSVIMCTLDISPASSNKFNIPVILTANCNGAAASDPSSLGMAWFNPSTWLWEPVTGSKADASWNVTAPLRHFSIYGVFGGKAGW